MKSLLQNVSDGPLTLAPYGGITLGPRGFGVVEDDPATVNLRLAALGPGLYRVVRSADDGEPTSTASGGPTNRGYISRGSCKFDKNGVLAAGSSGVTGVTRTGVGTYTVTLTNALPSTDSTKVRVRAIASGDATGPATCTGAIIDTTHIAVAAAAPGGGAAIDSGAAIEVLDFGWSGL